MRFFYVLMIVLVGCTAAGNYTSTPLTEQDSAVVKKAFRIGLLDPLAAQVEDIRVFVNPEGVRIICGKVNSKNAFGGYVGFQTFIVQILPSLDYSQPNVNPIFGLGAIAQIDCGGAGYQ